MYGRFLWHHPRWPQHPSESRCPCVRVHYTITCVLCRFPAWWPWARCVSTQGLSSSPPGAAVPAWLCAYKGSWRGVPSGVTWHFLEAMLSRSWVKGVGVACRGNEDFLVLCSAEREHVRGSQIDTVTVTLWLPEELKRGDPGKAEGGLRAQTRGLESGEEAVQKMTAFHWKGWSCDS